jgi:hypothetical protein
LEEVLKRNFFDLRNREFLNLIKIIDSALQSTESVLVHSFDGLSRSPSVVMGYLMFKYCWGVDKAHEFLLSKKPEMKPHESYIEQLCLLETQLQASFQEKASEEQFYNWNPDTVDPNNSDEIVLLNTYLNYRATKGIFINNEENRCIKTQRLTWIDQHPEFVRVLLFTLVVILSYSMGYKYTIYNTDGKINISFCRHVCTLKQSSVNPSVHQITHTIPCLQAMAG